MSAFIVDDSTINNIVTWIYNEVREKTYQTWIERLLPDYNLKSDIGFNKLADDMFKLNIQSVNQRYEENSEFKDFEFQYQYNHYLNNPYQALKCFRCWLYQCCEEDIPENSTLYKALEIISLEFALSLVQKLEVYNKAEGWN